MSIETEPAPPVLAGDKHDDDGQVLDDLLQQEAAPPSPDELPMQQNQGRTEPRRTTRTLTRGMTLRNTFGAQMIFPADPDRQSLRINVMFPGGVAAANRASVVRFSDDAGKLETDDASFLIPATGDVSVEHTGPVWLRVPNHDDGVTEQSLYVSCIAVTS